jgi:hypothetical protein
VAGARPHNCPPGPTRIIHDGAAGKPGQPGQMGPAGPAGGYHGTFTTTVITEAEWQAALAAPHVAQVSPTQVSVGATVTLTGVNFRPDDVVQLAGTNCVTTYLSDTTVQFVVADVPGGVNPPVVGVVRSTDGATTKPFGLEVLPSVTFVTPGSAGVGAQVTVTGTGFPPNAGVLLDGDPQPFVAVEGTYKLTFTVRMPTNPHLPGSVLTVVLADGTPSNSVALRITASGVFVGGDSVMWGQGLLPSQKFSTLVAERWTGGTSLAPTVAAHSGATIGVGDATPYGPIDGEVPTSYPTILDQVAQFTGNPDDVGLVLLNGGINDCDVRTILSPLSNDDLLINLAQRYCGQAMGTLLDAVCAKFPRAQVCVTGYYQLLSQESLDSAGLALTLAFLNALNVFLGIASDLTLLDLGQVAARSGTWAATANTQLQQAVTAAAARNSRNIVFANPGFTGQNAVFASDTLLFGINLDMSPQDPVAATRKTACQLAGVRTDEVVCERASIGHPNPTGAQRYATAIDTALGLT